MTDNSINNAWLLPDGIQEVLPAEARVAEALRRELLDLYERWGYDLVIPPLIEFTDSLLTGSGVDLDIKTFKMTDRLSGKTLGIRADITPQTARMDAHSLKRSGPNRLCYAGTVLRTETSCPLESRSPIQIGVELYGVTDIGADIEVISLMIESLSMAGLSDLTLDLGHVGVLDALIGAAHISASQKASLVDRMQTKMRAELQEWLELNLADDAHTQAFMGLLDFAGGDDVLPSAKQFLCAFPDVAKAIDDLQEIVQAIRQRYPSVNIYIDLSESRGYNYHSGVVFAAYIPECGSMVANGGRYDSIGQSFGRARAATGFNTDLKTLIQRGTYTVSTPQGILASWSDDADFAQAVNCLRNQGERVICQYGDTPIVEEEIRCDRELVLQSGQWIVRHRADS